MGSSFLDEEDAKTVERKHLRKGASMGSSFLDEEDVAALGGSELIVVRLQWGPRFSTRKTG